MKSEQGSECNRAKIGGTTRLLGDPSMKLEKPYTIIKFPGGSVEVTRTTDGDYWVHVAVSQDFPSDPVARIVDARLDAKARYADEINEMLKSEVMLGDVEHIAFLVSASD